MQNNAPYYPVGLYLGEVVSQALGQAKTGTAQFIVRFKILGTPLDDGSYDPAKQVYERTMFMALTPKTMDFVVPQIKQMGFNGSSIAQLDPSHPQHVDLTGNQVNLWCSHKTDLKGVLRENWGISSGPQKIEAIALQPKQLKQLDALFGKALKAAPAVKTRNSADFDMNQETGPEPVNQEGPEPTDPNDPGITDDDIPKEMFDENPF